MTAAALIRTIPTPRTDSADAVADTIADMARPLPLELHATFAEQVMARLRALPADMIGEGLVHRICVEDQRHFCKPIVVGARTKYDWSR